MPGINKSGAGPEKLRNDGFQDAFPMPAERVGGECTAIVLRSGSAGAGQSPADLNSAQPRLGAVELRHGALEDRELEPRVEAPLTGNPDHDSVIGRFKFAGEFRLTVRAKYVEPDDARISP